MSYLWMFKDKNGRYLEIGQKGEFGACSTNSDKLEELFIQDSSTVVRYKSSEYEYELDMGKMIQRNTSTNTERRVYRKRKHVWRYSNYYGKIVTYGAQALVSSTELELEYLNNKKGKLSFEVFREYIIDFAKMEQTNLETNARRKVYRSLLYIWTLKDKDGNLLEIGQKGEFGACDTNSDKLEEAFAINPESVLRYKSSEYEYELDMDKMIQRNTSTNKERRVYRKRMCVWSFKDCDGIIVSYDVESTIKSAEIESSYQKDNNGQFRFKVYFNYEIDMANMEQTNLITKSKEKVFRHPVVLWYFKDISGVFQPFGSKGEFGKCAITSKDLEDRYEKNEQSCVSYGTPKYNYELHMDTMRQCNQETKVQRKVGRVTGSEVFMGHYVWFFIDRFDKLCLMGNEGEFGGVNVSPKNLTSRYNQNPEQIVEYATNKFSYELDMSQLIQTNKSNGTKRQVHRVPLWIRIPDLWDFCLTSHKTVRIKEVDMNCCGIATITQIRDQLKKLEVVQNFKLLKRFAREKLILTKRKDIENIQEIWAFHGTTDDGITNIVKQGFDISKAGSCTGSLYGKGIYLARDLKVAKGYGKESKKVLMCRVLIGKYIEGESGMKEPPLVDENCPDKGRYDLCVRNQTDPDYFIFYNSHRCLPAFILHI